MHNRMMILLINQHQYQLKIHKASYLKVCQVIQKIMRKMVRLYLKENQLRILCIERYYQSFKMIWKMRTSKMIYKN